MATNLVMAAIPAAAVRAMDKMVMAVEMAAMAGAAKIVEDRIVGDRTVVAGMAVADVRVRRAARSWSVSLQAMGAGSLKTICAVLTTICAPPTGPIRG
jgi:hypothetical protein